MSDCFLWYYILSLIHCAFLSYTLSPFLPTSDWRLGSSTDWVHCRGPRDLCSWPPSGASPTCQPSGTLSSLCYLRARPPFMSSPLSGLENSLYLFASPSLRISCSPLPASFLFPLVISFLTALHRGTQRLLRTWSIVSFAVLSNAPQFSSLLSATALLYIHIFGKAVNGEKSQVSFWKGLMFRNLIDSTTFVC